MATINSLMIHDQRRREMLQKLAEHKRDGFQVEVDDPAWYRDTLISLNNDRLCYPLPVAGVSPRRLAWFISDKGQQKLKGTRK